MESGVRMETVLKLIQRVDSRETDKKQEQEKRQLLEELREGCAAHGLQRPLVPAGVR